MYVVCKGTNVGSTGVFWTTSMASVASEPKGFYLICLFIIMPCLTYILTFYLACFDFLPHRSPDSYIDVPSGILSNVLSGT